MVAAGRRGGGLEPRLLRTGLCGLRALGRRWRNRCPAAVGVGTLLCAVGVGWRPRLVAALFGGTLVVWFSVLILVRVGLLLGSLDRVMSGAPGGTRALRGRPTKTLEALHELLGQLGKSLGEPLYGLG